MIDRQFLKKISPWLNDRGDEAAELAYEKGISEAELVGLRPDAPQSAKKAFAEFCKNEELRRKKGIQ